MVHSGEVAWVTGSSTGIGRAIALELADRGCDVTVHYKRSEKEAKEVSERIRASGTDTLLVREMWRKPRTWRGWFARSRIAMGGSTSW